jgi:CheY-like chemotaxis protein
MGLMSLLVCADAEAVQVLSGIFHDLGLEVESCGDPTAAQAQIDERRFDVLVVDCQPGLPARSLIAYARKSAMQRGAIIIALVSGRNQVKDILAKGANFLLYKPVSRERALHSIYAARALMRQERRVKPRVAVHAPASIAYPGKEDASATVLELSESGLGIRTAHTLPPSGKVYFQFALPGQASAIRLSGEVMWRDAGGRVGIRFVNLPQSSKRLLQRWLEEQSAWTLEKRPASGDGPENRDAHENNDALKNDEPVRVSAGLGLLSASASDRRNLSRHACCLGAEVYRAQNSVPYRCSLSDISEGGCYIETAEPFPSGTEVEIRVRTHEFKLSVMGKVSSTHRGFGMGVCFHLRNDHERAQVQELIACAEAEPKLDQ